MHRLGIQAFEPVLVEGQGFKDPSAGMYRVQRGTLTETRWPYTYRCLLKHRRNARFLMLASNNILKPQDGKPVVSPTQDMVIGSYYMTIDRDGAKGEKSIFMSVDEAILAYETGQISPAGQDKSQA